jgi:protease I
MPNLANMKVAVLATDGFEESELTEPVRTLREEGAEVEILSVHDGEIQAFHHHDKAGRVKVDRLIKEVSASDYHAVLLPGGALNADQLRVDPDVKSFVAQACNDGKPIAAICHAAWILISSGIVRNRKLTSYHTIQDDVRNAGGSWTDEEVVVDGNLVSSRKPSDIPAFSRAMIDVFGHMAPGKVDEALSA